MRESPILPIVERPILSILGKGRGVTPAGLEFAYDNLSYYVGGQDASPWGHFINPDRAKLFMFAYNANAVHQYTLGDPDDISQTSYDTVSYVPAGGGFTRGLDFKLDGLRFYYTEPANDRLYQTNLITPWSLTGASDGGFLTSNLDNNWGDIRVSPDGTKAIAFGTTTRKFYHFDLANPGDITSATPAAGTGDILSIDAVNNVNGFDLTYDGKTMMVMVGATNEIHRMTLPEGWNPVGMTYDNWTLDTSVEGASGALFLAFDEPYMYVVNDTTDSILQYSRA